MAREKLADLKRQLSEGIDPAVQNMIAKDKSSTFFGTVAQDWRKISHGANPKYQKAEILDAVNYLYPFREGNGRTQR